MADLKADLDALDAGIKTVIPIALDRAGIMWGKLKLLERGEPSRLVGNGAAGSVEFRVTCHAFANRYLEVANDLIANQKAFIGALETFRDTLQAVLDSYRTHELRQQEGFRAILRDSEGTR